jgi:hypothetical protein
MTVPADQEMPMNLSRSDSQILKMSCRSDEIDVMVDEKEDGNISTEYESETNECKTENWTVKTLKL